MEEIEQALTKALKGLFDPFSSKIQAQADDILFVRLLLIAVCASLEKDAANRAIETLDLIEKEIGGSQLSDSSKESFSELAGQYRLLLQNRRVPSLIGFITTR